MNIFKHYPKLYKNRDWSGIANKLFHYYIINWLYCNWKLFRRCYRVLGLLLDFVRKEYGFNEYTRPNCTWRDFVGVAKYNWRCR